MKIQLGQMTMLYHHSNRLHRRLGCRVEKEVHIETEGKNLLKFRNLTFSSTMKRRFQSSHSRPSIDE